MKLCKIVFYILMILFFKSPVSAEYQKIFFDFKVKSILGETLDLKKYENKTILLVNTASYCGFTKQYDDLQKLWDKYKSNGLIVLGVPSNTFNQEKNTNKEVKEFCEVNFNIDFPMTSISEVKGDEALDIYKWAKKNYGNSAVPKWNFHKILINKEGKIQNTFGSFTSPISKKIISEIEKILKI